MYKYILAFAIGGVFISCGETKEIVEESATEIVEETTETVEETTEEVTEVVEETVDVVYSGIIRDRTETDGCSFLIEVDLANSTELLEPVHLDEEYQTEGLKVEFTYTYSKRPSTCGIATPILLGTITG